MSNQDSDQICIDRFVDDLDISTHLQRIRFTLRISSGSSADATLTDRLKIFVQRYRARSQDTYYNGVIETVQHANAAADLIDLVSQGLAKLDSPHTLNVGYLLVALKDSVQLGSNLAEATTILNRFQSSLRELAADLEFVTSVKSKTGPGRPQINYVSETQELMEIYNEVTGKRVVFPKWIGAGEPQQPSTLFIFMALKMINHQINKSQAMTCIKKALKLNSQVDAILRELCPNDF